MAKSKTRVYEMNHSWDATPIFKGTPQQVARKTRELAKSELVRGDKWAIIISEKVRSTPSKPVDPWAGSVIIEHSPKGPTVKASIHHHRHNSEWGKDIYDYQKQLHEAQYLPPLSEVLGLSTSERKALWRKRHEDAKALLLKYESLLHERDDLANERMGEVADGLKAIGIPATYKAAQGVSIRQFPDEYLKTPDKAEDTFLTRIKWLNQEKLINQQRHDDGTVLYKGYVLQPDGSYRFRRLSRKVVQEVFANHNFAPRRRGKEQRVGREAFPIRRGA